MIFVMPAMFIVLLAFAAVSVSRGQILGDPPGEPWNFIISEACGKKNVDIQSAWQAATSCYQTIPSSGAPLSFCSHKDVRDDCLKPYYDELKKCYDKDDVDEAFDIQEESIDFICEDDQKRYKELVKQDAMSCARMLTDNNFRECWNEASKMYDVDVMDLFSDDNCQLMLMRNECMLKSVESCSMTLHDFVRDQFKEMLKKKCNYPNGASTTSAPVLIVGLIAVWVIKFFI